MQIECFLSLRKITIIVFFKHYKHQLNTFVLFVPVTATVAENISNKKVDNKSLEKTKQNKNNMIVNTVNESKEKEVVNKSKYPRNERVRVSILLFFQFVKNRNVLANHTND